MKDDDFKLLRGFVTDRWTDGRTFVNVESLSRLKIEGPISQDPFDQNETKISPYSKVLDAY